MHYKVRVHVILLLLLQLLLTIHKRLREIKNNTKKGIKTKATKITQEVCVEEEKKNKKRAMEVRIRSNRLAKRIHPSQD